MRKTKAGRTNLSRQNVEEKYWILLYLTYCLMLKLLEQMLLGQNVLEQKFMHTLLEENITFSDKIY